MCDDISLGNLTEVKSILSWISDDVIYYRCVCVCCHLSLGIGLVNVLGSKGGQCLQDVAIDLDEPILQIHLTCVSKLWLQLMVQKMPP